MEKLHEVKIKHSKFKNTGLIYELLVKQVTSDLIERKDSPAVNILRKYYSGNNALVQEHRLYKTVLDNIGISSLRADNLITEALKAARKINQKELRELKYKLISEIKENYDLENFLTIQVPTYKALASFYCLLEADSSKELIDPSSIVNNKTTLLEYMTCKPQTESDVTDSLIKEFANSDRDLRLLTFKVLLEKFNKRYANLLPEQKNVLRHFIATESAKGLRDFVNEEQAKISTRLQELGKKLPRGIERIKLMEVLKMTRPIPNTEKITDNHLVTMLQFYDLIAELQRV